LIRNIRLARLAFGTPLTSKPSMPQWPSLPGPERLGSGSSTTDSWAAGNPGMVTVWTSPTRILATQLRSGSGFCVKPLTCEVVVRVASQTLMRRGGGALRSALV